MLFRSAIASECFLSLPSPHPTPTPRSPRLLQILAAAIANGAFAINRSSVFNDEQQWRHPQRGGRRRLHGTESVESDASAAAAGPARAAPAAAAAAAGGAAENGGKEGEEADEGGGGGQEEEEEETLSEASRGSSAFGGGQFWQVGDDGPGWVGVAGA